MAQLRKYTRYRLTGVAPTPTGQPNAPQYMAGFLPRLADSLDKELMLSRARGQSGDKEHYVYIPPHLPADAPIDGLTKDVQDKDFENAVHLVQVREKK